MNFFWMKKHETCLTTRAIQKYELWKTMRLIRLSFVEFYICHWKMLKNIGSETTYSKTFCLLKLFYPWRERYRRSELRNQLPAQWAAKPAVSVNFHRLVIIILGAPLTCNTPAAAPPETKKTTPRMFSFLYLRFGVLKYEIWLSLISI